ncbi:MAG: iron-sulfur cluster assembly protein, partial [Rhizobiales bacterium]|nr:iron-sulfur cluster assembly protein [Hyphomicrobiales bacterium]
MTALDQNAILERLRSVEGPDGKGDIVSLGLVSDILIHGGKVMFSITVDAARANALEPLREKAAAAVRGLDG